MQRGGWGCCTVAPLHGTVWRQRTPRAPPLRRFSPAELIPCSSGLTNYTAQAPTALSRHRFTLQQYPSHHPPPPILPPLYSRSHTPTSPLDSSSLSTELSVLIFPVSRLSLSPAHSFPLHLIAHLPQILFTLHHS